MCHTCDILDKYGPALARVLLAAAHAMAEEDDARPNEDATTVGSREDREAIVSAFLLASTFAQKDTEPQDTLDAAKTLTKEGRVLTAECLAICTAIFGISALAVAQAQREAGEEVTLSEQHERPERNRIDRKNSAEAARTALASLESLGARYGDHITEDDEGDEITPSAEELRAALTDPPSPFGSSKKNPPLMS